MTRALWKKNATQALGLLAALTLLLFAFMWLFVWFTSMIPQSALLGILLSLAGPLQRIFGLPLKEVVTTEGMIALAYMDPLTLLASAIWGISRGSDVVAGELERGTLEMTLAQPVRRIEVLWSHAAITVLGCALLSVAAWLGTCTGLATVDLGEEAAPPMGLYLPPAVNLFFLSFFVAALATLFSAVDRYRWRVIGVVSGIYIVQMILKLAARMAPKVDWLLNLSFLAAFEPQKMVADPDAALAMSLECNAILLGLGVACYAAATVVFCRRDLPAPL